jgi:energy-coupling factor transporter transmembrane protein EcfT
VKLTEQVQTGLKKPTASCPTVHINAFDHYLSRDSIIHRLDPRVKVMVTVFFILSNVLLPDGAWLAFGAAWGLVLLGNQLQTWGGVTASAALSLYCPLCWRR